MWLFKKEKTIIETTEDTSKKVSKCEMCGEQGGSIIKYGNQNICWKCYHEIPYDFSNEKVVLSKEVEGICGKYFIEFATDGCIRINIYDENKLKFLQKQSHVNNGDYKECAIRAISQYEKCHPVQVLLFEKWDGKCN